MGSFENVEFVPGLKIDGFEDLKFGRGHFENCIRPFKKHQKWVQMIPNGFFWYFPAQNWFFLWAGCWDSAEIDPWRRYTGAVQYRSLAAGHGNVCKGTNKSPEHLTVHLAKWSPRAGGRSHGKSLAHVQKMTPAHDPKPGELGPLAHQGIRGIDAFL